MPYIDQELRDDLKPASDTSAETAGQLNFQITSLIQDYWAWGEKGYQRINDIIGALEGAKLEFYRRIAAPYEDRKIKLNGDVY